jgi:hypothetical protein
MSGESRGERGAGLVLVAQRGQGRRFPRWLWRWTRAFAHGLRCDAFVVEATS